MPARAPGAAMHRLRVSRRRMISSTGMAMRF
jgi:hypothetical protein